MWSECAMFQELSWWKHYTYHLARFIAIISSSTSISLSCCCFFLLPFTFLFLLLFFNDIFKNIWPEVTLKVWQISHHSNIIFNGIFINILQWRIIILTICIHGKMLKTSNSVSGTYLPSFYEFNKNLLYCW